MKYEPHVYSAISTFSKDMQGLHKASLRYFLETGKISGQLLITLTAIAESAYNKGRRDAKK